MSQLNSRVSMASLQELSGTINKRRGEKSLLLIIIRFKAVIAKRFAGIRLSTSVYGKNKFTISPGYLIATLLRFSLALTLIYIKDVEFL